MEEQIEKLEEAMEALAWFLERMPKGKGREITMQAEDLLGAAIRHAKALSIGHWREDGELYRDGEYVRDAYGFVRRVQQ